MRFFRYSLAGIVLTISFNFSALGNCRPAAVSTAAATRFLTQASWAPTAEAVAQVAATGFDCYIEDQIALPASPIPDATLTDPVKQTYVLRPVQEAFFYNAVTGKDQLRQRMAWALGQIWVVSAVKLKAQAIPPYNRILQRNAFGTYDVLMKEVTLSPAMGRYLDMVNNNKPTATKGANENYARELLQLFTIGLNVLHDDGTAFLIADRPVPAYSQDIVEGFARSFTGWTYAPLPGTVSRFGNPENYADPMVAFAANHDTDAKQILSGVVLPIRQTPESDLNSALMNIFNHRNVGPFVCRQLIQHFVTSDPSPAFVNRVVNVFNSYPRGDLKAVIRAILLDSEARGGDAYADFAAAGYLKEPALFLNGVLRRLGATIVPPDFAKGAGTTGLITVSTNLGQNIFYPPTVFNYYAPDYKITDGQTRIAANAPEFQLMSGATAMSRMDVWNTLAFGKMTGVSIDSTLLQWQNIVGTTPTATSEAAMVDAVFATIVGGATPKAVKDTVLASFKNLKTPKSMVSTALYLIGSKWSNQVVR